MHTLELLLGLALTKVINPIYRSQEMKVVEALYANTCIRMTLTGTLLVENSL